MKADKKDARGSAPAAADTRRRRRDHERTRGVRAKARTACTRRPTTTVVPVVAAGAHSGSASSRIAAASSGEMLTHTPRVWATTVAKRHNGAKPEPLLRT